MNVLSRWILLLSLVLGGCATDNALQKVPPASQPLPAHEHVRGDTYYN